MGAFVGKGVVWGTSVSLLKRKGKGGGRNFFWKTVQWGMGRSSVKGSIRMQQEEIGDRNGGMTAPNHVLCSFCVCLFESVSMPQSIVRGVVAQW